MNFTKPPFVVSPYFFHRNTESRFNFARSMDPKEEAAVCLSIPQEIQDILERNIRTMSIKADKSSIDNTSSTDIIDFKEDWGYTLDRLRFENERMVEFASRRSSPRNKQPRHNLSPRSEMNKKSGSLNKRKEEISFNTTMSNHLYIRSSMNSKQEHFSSEALFMKNDSETTSNNEIHQDQHKVGADVESSALQGGKQS
uniref:Uncharacterized protein n=1 Tax=Euplotes harpa TaxID=151035 RepID=A0A7S3JP64_9SPIT|mmetsp:Transcript_8197/g.9304  ORF Transcript_8197/g.9304 Transcript_8197/m.9304 type:complete len:198 (+) Transcript_8197:394-987(+)